MKIKVSDYIARYLTERGIRHGFTVTGGGAMHLNDSFGHQEGLEMIYHHHEQACAIAAESYARIHNQIALVCVTTGPGGINALNGVAGAYLDSIPMLVISGQVRYDTTARSTGLPLRAMGDQEFDICRAVESMTKYCEMVILPQRIRYCLDKALYLAQSGRPGPCWLDIPLNVQGAYIEEEAIEQYERYCPKEDAPDTDPVTPELAEEILERIAQAKRPVLYAGNGIRLAGAAEAFETLVQKLQIPVVTCWDSIDLMKTDDILYAGRGGIMGDRAGNFAVQNADLLLSVGSRLSIRQVGYHHESWARAAYVIMNDIDRAELQKPTLHVEMPVCADAGELIAALLKRLEERERRLLSAGREAADEDGRRAAADTPMPDGIGTSKRQWVEQCERWKRNYPVVQPAHYEQNAPINVYALIHELSRRLPEGQVTVVGNGSACVVGSAAYVIKRGQRFIINSAIASMGYDLPAAIGACVASEPESSLKPASGTEPESSLKPASGAEPESSLKPTSGAEPEVKLWRAEIICVTGEGSLQMNIQELQTIIHHRFPIKIFVINNNGYHSIRQTQNKFFEKGLVGVGGDSGDLSFPALDKLAAAYGFPYFRLTQTQELTGERLTEVLASKGPFLCEIFVSTEQQFEPKSAAKRLEDGTLVSPPLEDLAPFLPKEELRENMYIPLWEEEA